MISESDIEPIDLAHLIQRAGKRLENAILNGEDSEYYTCQIIRFADEIRDCLEQETTDTAPIKGTIERFWARLSHFEGVISSAWTGIEDFNGLSDEAQDEVIRIYNLALLLGSNRRCDFDD